MARRKPDKKKKSRPDSGDGSEFPSESIDFGALNDIDPRSLEGVLSNFLQGFQPEKKKRGKKTSPLDKAQELMYEAFETRDLDKQKDSLLDDIAKRLEQHVENEILFTIRWRIV